MKQFTVLTMLPPLLIIAAIVLQTAGAFANDSPATRLGAGGLTFTKSEDIRMLEEVIEISTKLIRVKFRFLNESDKDIHTMVAFPGPSFPSPWLNAHSGISDPDGLWLRLRFG